MVVSEIHEYYNKQKVACGWGNLYYGVFSSLIKEYNSKITAEVGCGYGQHSKQILENTNVEIHYMIDQYKYYPNDGFSDGIKSVNAPISLEQKFDDFCEMIKLEIKPFNNRVEFIRKSSIDASKNFKDNSIDAIFIDANHEFKYVLEDLYAYWPKVKSGGIIAGDDYCIEDVKKAVHYFETYNGVKVHFRIKEGTDYKIYYFIKP